MPFDELCGGRLVDAFIDFVREQTGGTGYVTREGALRLLLTHKVVGYVHPQELSEPLVVVKDKEGFRAWAAAVRMGVDPIEAAEQFTCKKEEVRCRSRS